MKLLLIIFCLIICIHFSLQISFENIPKNEKFIDFINKRKLENAVEIKKKNIFTHDKNPICLLPPESGICLALFWQYYFNKETGKCELFVYGGCKGNSNRFETLQECENACLR